VFKSLAAHIRRNDEPTRRSCNSLRRNLGRMYPVCGIGRGLQTVGISAIHSKRYDVY
jgi:hypothetical protein